ncbi:MAG: DNA mismatch repair endonuclease MutL [Acholeplasmataceae bacterium]
MPSIRVMVPRLANMIAAGEVVDRPASIVKELVENAIDAKADRITIAVEEAGMKRIEVTDNGHGMTQEDARLAFLRHATSKIASETDLSHIRTLGFRGEALAAISAVGKVTLRTRRANSLGSFVKYNGGALVDQGSATLNEGTVVTVTDLFYNTPARFKYMKSEATERNAIIDTFDRLALANPAVGFRLVIDGKTTKETVGDGDYARLIDAIYGKRMTADMTVFERSVQKIGIRGYLLSPKISRSRKKDISLFVNGRYFKNYRLTQAVIDGYHSFLMVNRYPIALIHLELDPSLIDVNVHPQKLQVKFASESLVSYQLEKFVKEALTKRNHAVQEAYEKRESIPESYQKQELFLEEAPALPEESAGKLPQMDYIGTYAGTYLLFQNEKALYFMDQHAAAERIRYEHYFHALSHPKKATAPLMIPYELGLTRDDFEHLREGLSHFEAYGFSFDDRLALTGIPTWLREDEIELAVETMVAMLAEKDRIDLAALRDRLAKDISCKGAIRANQALNRAEVESLYRRLKECENPYTCPHGRPTVIELSEYRIERMFRRIV